MCYLVLMTVKLRSYSGVRQFKTTAIKEVSTVQLPHYFSNSDMWISSKSQKNLPVYRV